MNRVTLNFDNYKKHVRRKITELTVHIAIWIIVAGSIAIQKLYYDGIYKPANDTLLNRPMPPLTVKMYSDSRVVDYTTQALIDCLNFNFTNSERKLRKCSRYFEGESFSELINILNTRNIVSEINSGNILSTELKSVPLMLDKELPYDKYYWPVYVRLKVNVDDFKLHSRKSSRGSYEQRLEIHIVRSLDFTEGFALKVASIKSV